MPRHGHHEWHGVRVCHAPILAARGAIPPQRFVNPLTGIDGRNRSLNTENTTTVRASTSLTRFAGSGPEAVAARIVPRYDVNWLSNAEQFCDPLLCFGCVDAPMHLSSLSLPFSHCERSVLHVLAASGGAPVVSTCLHASSARVVSRSSYSFTSSFA